MGALTANWVGALCSAVNAKVAEAADGAGATDAGALLTCLSFREVGIGELGQVLGLTGSGAVRLVDRLERDGLVTRQARQGRAVSVRLSARGSQRAEELERRRLAALESLVGSLTADERAQLTTLVDKLVQGAGLDAPTARIVCRFCDHGRCDGDTCPIRRSLRERNESAARAVSRAL